MGMTAEQVSFVQLNTSAIADSVSGTTATFTGRTFATPPADFPSIRKSDFKVFLNNRRIPNTQVSSIVQNGSDIVVNINVASFLDIPGAVFESDDEVLLVGKFS